jgi:DNA-binding transcriptional ArsR family regulator
MIAGMARAATTSDVFNAIAEPQRRRILDLLRGRELPVSEVVNVLDLPQSSVSKHLRVLREVDLVRVRGQGKQRLYGLKAGGMRPVHQWAGGFEPFWEASLDRLDDYVQELKEQQQETRDDR